MPGESGNMFKRILVPTDGSERSKDAAEEAIELARSIGGEVFFLYVVDTSVISGIPEDWAWEQLEDVMQSEGETVVSDLSELASSEEVVASAEVVEGVPHREILEYADDKDIDLIVMATAGRRGLDKLLMGSTTERVLRSSDLPVLVIRGGSSE